jgi:hypothetical protein
MTTADLITILESATADELIKLSRLMKFAATIQETTNVDGPIVSIVSREDKKPGQFIDFAIYNRDDINTGRAARKIEAGEMVRVNLGTGEIS